MRIAKVGVYSIKELTGKSRERALEHGRQFQNDTFDSQELGKDLEEHFSDKFGVVCTPLHSRRGSVEYRLSYCQGDGVAIYGHLDVTELSYKHENIKAIVDKAGESDTTFDVKVTQSGRYHHYNSMIVDSSPNYGDDADRDEMDKLSVELDAAILVILKEASRSAEAFGYECIEATNEEEYVIESLEANEVEFDVNGNRFSCPEIEG